MAEEDMIELAPRASWAGEETVKKIDGLFALDCNESSCP